MANLVQLIYASAATYKMSTQELVDLLQISRKNNSALEITGMLLYRDGNFLQVIEGDDRVIDELYTKISKDRRHHSIVVIGKRNVSAKQFSEWAMGFTNLDRIDLTSVPGYSDYLSSPFTPNSFAKNPTRATIFLETFKNYGR